MEECGLLRESMGNASASHALEVQNVKKPKWDPDASLISLISEFASSKSFMTKTKVWGNPRILTRGMETV